MCLHTKFLWQMEHESSTSFISTHTHIQGCIIVLYKYLTLCAKGMFMVLYLNYYFVWTSRSSRIMNGAINHFMWWFSSLKFDLQWKFIAHYERCILLPYYHTCPVKFKSVLIIVFQTHCTQTHAHIHLHTSLQELDIGFLFKFS